MDDNELPAGVSCVTLGRSHRHERRAKALALYRAFCAEHNENPRIRNGTCPLGGLVNGDETEVIRLNVGGYRMGQPVVVPGGCRRCGNALVRSWFDGDGLACVACGRPGGQFSHDATIVQLELAL